jgi:hypothetical protein
MAPAKEPAYKNVIRTDITVMNNQITELGQTKLD